MKGKKLAACLASTLIACLVSLAHAEPPKPIKLVYSSYVPEQHIISISDKEWCKEIMQKTNGQVHIELHFGEELFKGPEQLKATSNGLIDICNLAPGYHMAEMPLAAGLQMPYLTEKPNVMVKVIQDLWKTSQPFRSEFERNGVILMQPSVVPETWIYMRDNPIRSMADIKGKKIRAYGWLAGALQNLGANAVGLPFGELYTALERGVLDGFTGISIEALDGFGMHEICKYFTDVGFGYYASSLLIMNKDRWENLPDGIKVIMRDTSERCYERWCKSAAVLMEKSMNTYIKAGIKINQLSKNERDQWRLVGMEIHNKWIKSQRKEVPAREFLEVVKKLITEYEGKTDYSTGAWAVYNRLK